MVPAPSYASARVKRGNRLVALAILVFFGADAAVVRIAGAGPPGPGSVFMDAPPAALAFRFRRINGSWRLMGYCG
ncbi:hypothetical protein DD718_09425 [Bifidobacterium bifidum]|nr:hypothetical protein B216_08581 [Bifidobacterium bifidum LMG 13195]PVV33421.1 hypothetical protein DD718_09425 [Bifidobacterium bifidum]RHK44207.1 hypothetical protein DW065_04330 [Bifidobacterium bifidum]GDZ24251.1 hypothetical protein MCC01958_07370 [Bifidobacteriaceae bacterium MCC01958]GJM47240.1 hypothetical protein BbifJCM1254_16070 [Bifidobacterium bifidum JCM 1254]